MAPGLTLEFAYRYINLGDAQSGFFHNVAGVTANSGAYQFKNIDSHDIKFGLRWMLD